MIEIDYGIGYDWWSFMRFRFFLSMQIASFPNNEAVRTEGVLTVLYFVSDNYGRDEGTIPEAIFLK